jgi:hypothetical protein
VSIDRPEVEKEEAQGEQRKGEGDPAHPDPGRTEEREGDSEGGQGQELWVEPRKEGGKEPGDQSHRDPTARAAGQEEEGGRQGGGDLGIERDGVEGEGRQERRDRPDALGEEGVSEDLPRQAVDEAGHEGGKERHREARPGIAEKGVERQDEDAQPGGVDRVEMPGGARRGRVDLERPGVEIGVGLPSVGLREIQGVLPEKALRHHEVVGFVPLGSRGARKPRPEKGVEEKSQDDEAPLPLGEEPREVGLEGQGQEESGPYEGHHPSLEEEEPVSPPEDHGHERERREGEEDGGPVLERECNPESQERRDKDAGESGRIRDAPEDPGDRVERGPVESNRKGDGDDAQGESARSHPHRLGTANSPHLSFVRRTSK